MQLHAPSFIIFSMNILIENARVMDPKSESDEIANLYLEDGKIRRIFTSKEHFSPPEDCRRIDATGLIATCGLVDIHVHFREPGFTHKEDIASGARAAAAGGYTTVVMMANTRPVIDNVAVLGTLKERILAVEAQTPLHILPSASVSVNLTGEELTDFEALSKAGAAGFTDDGIPLMDEALLQEAFRRSAALQKPISLHEEDPRLITENGINAGPISAKMHLTGSPREAEITMIRRDLAIAEKSGAIVNIQHVSTKEGVELIREAKKHNPNLHAEATPHHFSLTQEDVLLYGTLAKMNPPLRTEDDRQAIIEGLRDDTIDVIATDHAPHAKEEKEREFSAAPSGIIGLETALSLGITNLVKPGHLTMMQLLKKMTLAPASLYALPCSLQEGERADLVLFDPDATRVFDSFYSKSANSPFLGKRLNGVVRYTVCDGKISYEKDLR